METARVVRSQGNQPGTVAVSLHLMVCLCMLSSDYSPYFNTVLTPEQAALFSCMSA